MLHEIVAASARAARHKPITLRDCNPATRKHSLSSLAAPVHGVRVIAARKNPRFKIQKTTVSPTEPVVV